MFFLQFVCGYKHINTSIEKIFRLKHTPVVFYAVAPC